MRSNQLGNDRMLVELQLAKSKNILRESCEGLTLEQKRVVENVYWHFLPLIEASIDPSNIPKIFKAIEDHPENKTAAGKAAAHAASAGKHVASAGKEAAEVVKQVNEILNQAGRWLQQTAPVNYFDDKFEDLKSKIVKTLGSKDSKIVQQVQNLGEIAKKNPGKTAVVIGVLTVLAGLGGGPVAGMIAGQVLRGTIGLVKGEKLSAVIGKGAKFAAIGGIAGEITNALGNVVDSDIKVTEPSVEGGLSKVEVETNSESIRDQLEKDSSPKEANSALANLSEEQFKLVHAQRIAERMNLNLSDEMLQKIADNVVITGEYPDGNFRTNFSGNFIRGSIYLTSEEQQAWQQFAQSYQGSTMALHFSDEATEWLKQNVEGAANQLGSEANDEIDNHADTSSSDEIDNPANTNSDEQPASSSSGALSSEEYAAKKADGTLRPAEITRYYIVNADELVKAAEEAHTGPSNSARISMKIENYLYAEYGDQIDQLKGSQKTRFIRYLTRIGQTAASESYDYKQFKTLSEGQVYLLFKRVDIAQSYLVEQGLVNRVKGAAGAVGQKIKQAGKRAANKVTADQLTKAWQAAGSPSEPDQLYQFLKDQGVSTDIIKPVYDTMKLPVPDDAAPSDNAAGTGQNQTGDPTSANDQAAGTTVTGQNQTGDPTSADTTQASTKEKPTVTLNDVKAKLVYIRTRNKQALLNYLKTELGIA
jgi:hypothetical protein